MNHAEWERKVKELEKRIDLVQNVGHLGPSELREVEEVIVELEKLLL